jgi:transposase, IS30 family
MKKGRHHTKLSCTERRLIATWKQKGVSNKEIGRLLMRHPSTIGRELRRNTHHRGVRIVYSGTVTFYREVPTCYYDPDQAQSLASIRKENAWRNKHPLKSPSIYRYVTKRLIRGWSPEQIAGRAQLEAGVSVICAETIYQFIYHTRNRHWHLCDYLRRGHKKRRRRNGRKVHRSRIPDRVSIHKRPEEIANRTVFGHWEGDSVVGVGHTSGIHTEYERVSSMYLIERMKDMTSTSSINAQIKLFESLPKRARKSTTLDNGSEHVKHIRLNKELDMDTYFADPYSAYQRGGNENGNLWLRYYFPKGTNFNNIEDEELKAVQWELNNRPRKRLGFKTPQEVFDDQLLKPKGCDRY